MPISFATTTAHHDVLIAGGGLAGLTLALQLKDALPTLDVRVVERRPHPAPAAAFKVGESSVEIGAHYFADILGLKEHLDAAHIRKFGFRFFFSDGEEDLSDVTELGASRFMSTPSWQIDRGVFENFLAEEAVRRGARFDDRTIVRRFDLNADGHTVELERDGVRETIHADWFIDASGRAGLVKRKLDLAEDNGHDANAVWFRLSERLPIDEWVDDPAWRARCSPSARWMSTNHLCGPGYWLWLIPLGSGIGPTAHSVGIVADAGMHPLATMNTFERAMEWIARHQPVVHAAILQAIGGTVSPEPEALLDFAFFRNFSYGCKQTFSPERWALTGEAGWFLDPFYSPGSDFIAISNTFITALVRAERAGESVRGPALFYGELFRSFYESTLTLYEGQYRLFGNERVMPIKVLWDYTFYWGVLCQIFFQHRLTDRRMFGVLAEPLQRARTLNATIQETLRTWGDATMASGAATRAGSGRSDHRGSTMLDQASVPWFAELNSSLRDSLGDTLDDAGFEARIRANVAQLERLAAEIHLIAAAETGAAASGLDATSMLHGMAA
jgi:flavin-dependent dehydrogenase